MVHVGGTGAATAYWWMRRIEKEAQTARNWQESYSPRLTGGPVSARGSATQPSPPADGSPRGHARRPNEERYWNHHNQPRAWAASQLGRSAEEDKFAVGGQRAARRNPDGSMRTMGAPVRNTSPLVDSRRPMASTAAERAARRAAVTAELDAERAAEGPLGDGAPQFRSQYSFSHGNPQLEGQPLAGGLPVLQQLSPRNHIAAGYLPGGEARSQYPRDKVSGYREMCISHRQIGYKGANDEGGSFINYRCGGAPSVWPAPAKNDRFG